MDGGPDPSAASPMDDVQPPGALEQRVVDKVIQPLDCRLRGTAMEIDRSDDRRLANIGARG